MEIIRSIDCAIVILIPVYNDWEALEKLLERLDDALADRGLEAGVLVVDDGSSQPQPRAAVAPSFRSLQQVDVLPLRRNLGHQRAVAISMAYVEDEGRSGTVVLMDGDGEDDPRDVPRLLAKCREEGDAKVVFAERTSRSESMLFQVFYQLYRLAHLSLTGQAVRFGNFSVLPRARLSSLVVVSDLWNHYVAAVLRSRQPYCSIETHRATRLDGQSKMNFVGLIVHGLSAISVYSDVAGIRLLILTVLVMVAASFGILAIIAVRLFTDWAIPGWATYSIGLLSILLFQSLISLLVLSIVILSGRNASSFIPSRDYKPFIGEARPLHGTP